MFCSNCGSQLKDGAVFCGNCGTAISAEQERVQPQPVYQQAATPPQAVVPNPKSVPVYSPAPVTPAAMPQNAMPASVPVYNRQPTVAKSALSKSGVTALVLSIAAFIVILIAGLYMSVDGWFGSYYGGKTHFMSDWIIGYIPMYLFCLVNVILGTISIYGKRTKHGLAGTIIAIADITLLFIIHVVTVLLIIA